MIPLRHTAFLLFILVAVPMVLSGQIRKIAGDTIIPNEQALDTLKIDNSETTSVRNNERIADSGLDREVVYGAIDTQIYDHRRNLMHLYGQAFVNYGDKELKADYIILDLNRNYADARQLPEYPGSIKPTFVDAGKEYRYRRLKYDFENEKGLVFDAIIREGEFIIHGERTKYVTAANNPYSDDDAGYNAGSLITTCDEEIPHFGFRAAKLKVVPEKVAVMGPSNLELSGIPTPVVVPFGFYPLTQGKSSGFIFPGDYEFNSRNKGFGLRGLGWYFPFNEYVHLRLTADIYTRGSFALYANTNYRKRYKYNGSAYLSYDRTITEDVESAQPLIRQGYTIRLNHQQEAKAHPYVNVGGSINIVSNNNQQRVYNDATSVLTNTYNSNFYYRHSMPGTPFNLSLGLNHSQNTNTHRVNISFPDAQLNMNTIYPFERRNKGSNEDRWYERISFDYDMQVKSFVNTTDSTLFTQEMYDNIKTGMNHSFNTALSTRVFKYFNLVPRADYDETWVLNTQEKTNIPVLDDQTNTFRDSIVERNEFGFDSYREYSAGISLNTQIFGTATFQKGWLRGIRHTVKPDIGFAYAPDTRSLYVDTLSLVGDETLVYTRFEDGPFNSPRFSDLQSQVTYRLNNILELKHFSRRDSTEKKFKLFDNLTIGGNYNFAADSLKWSRVSMNSTSRFFGGITTFITSWSFDPYIRENGRTVNKTTWSENGKLVRLDRAQFKLSNRINIKKLRELFARGTDDSGRDLSSRDTERQTLPSGPGEERFIPETGEETERKQVRASLLDIFNNINIGHEMQYNIVSTDEGNMGQLATHSIAVSGSVPLTENWNINIGNISYDFVRKGIGYPAFSFSRKLHCWNMSFSWYPDRDTYSFFIGVSSGTFSFLRYNYGQNNVDGAFNRF